MRRISRSSGVARTVTALPALACLALAMIPAAFLASSPSRAAPTAPESSPQPTLPTPAAPTRPASGGPKPMSPVVTTMIGSPTSSRAAAKPARPKHRRVARRHRRYDGPPAAELERPALAGVTLLVPLPPPGQPPHFVVPTPAYPLEDVTASFTTPPPPVVCHRVRREPDLPDPRLYREETLQCLPDNP